MTSIHSFGSYNRYVSIILTVRMIDTYLDISDMSVYIFHFIVIRIERLWRDVWSGVTNVFYHILHLLEEEGLLDLSNSMHFFCLQYVFLPRLNASLDVFREGWDNHPMRTEHNLTPNQLWETGQMQHPIPNPEVYY